jgi:hypothetical protein
MMRVAAGASGFFTFTPVGTPAGAVRPIPPLGDNALGAERASVSEDRFAVAVEVLAQQNAWTRLTQ